MVRRAVGASKTGHGLIWFAMLNGATVSTLYWTQSLAFDAATAFEASSIVRLIPAATFAGYAAGVALLAAAARDLTSGHGLLLHLIVLTAGLCALASAAAPIVSVLACGAIGLGCALTQRMLACATGAAPAEAQSGAVGQVIAAGLAGIVVARAGVPIASAWLGWQNLFWADAAIVAALGLAALAAVGRQPVRPPLGLATVPSALSLWRSARLLRRAGLQQAVVFAAYNLGWTVFPGLLAESGIAPAAAMGFVAGAGAIAALVSGRLCATVAPAKVARAGLTASVLAVALLLGTAALDEGPALGLAAMVMLDIGTQVALVANQSRAQALARSQAERGRVAAMMTTSGFAGGTVAGTLGALLTG